MFRSKSFSGLINEWNSLRSLQRIRYHTIRVLVYEHVVMSNLSQDYVEQIERSLFDSHRRCFKATARVDISRLVFDQSFKKQMDNQENIERFRRIMRIQGCQRLMQDCHVPVLIPVADWDSRVRLRRCEGSLDWLDVDIDYHLHAQDHETMITAARTRLGPTDQWWIVDVYVVEEAGRSYPCGLRVNALTYWIF